MSTLMCIIYQKINFQITYSLWDFASNKFEKRKTIREIKNILPEVIGVFI